MPVSHQVLIPLIALVCSGVGAYFGAYLKKKGENLATREDLSTSGSKHANSLRQHEKSKQKIDDQVWSRQRHWELKKEAVFSIMQMIGQVDNALFDLQIETVHVGRVRDQGMHIRISEKREVIDRLLDELEQKKGMSLLGMRGTLYKFNGGGMQKNERSVL